MKKFIVKVNGNKYEVEVEEVKNQAHITPAVAVKTPSQPNAQTPAGASAPAGAPASVGTSASTGATVSAGSNKAEPAKPAPAGAKTIAAPMPGTVLRMDVKPGDTVSKGSVLLILEAMKMENEITSPFDGRIASIGAGKGDTVTAGQALVTFD